MRSVTRMHLRSLVLSAATAALVILPLIPSPALAYVVRTSSSASSVKKQDLSVLTWGVYRGKSVYVPGKWTLAQGDDSVVFTQAGQTVSATTVPKEDCGYTAVRVRAQKAWGTARLNQSQGQVRTVVLGRSDYRGYTWREPSATTDGPDVRFWCLQQDIKKAVLLSVSTSDATLTAFVETSLIRQFATRHATH